MPEMESPSVHQNFLPPRGSVRYAAFGGILEGTRGDRAILESLIREINELGLARAELEIEGGRFSVLMDEAPVSTEGMEAARFESFVNLLQQLLEASPSPDSLESTLRCKIVTDREVQETLFVLLNGSLRCVSRTRPLQEGDRRQAPLTVWAPSISRFGGRHAILIGILLLIAFAILTWQGGYIDKIFSPKPGSLLLKTGPFGHLLKLEVEKSWGNYRVLIRRGKDFPESADKVKDLLESAVSAADRAAINTVADGDTIYAQLLSSKGKVLDFARVELRSLLSAGDAKVTGKLHGHIAAHCVQLSLDAGVSTDGR